MKESTVVKKYDFNKPDFDEIEFLLYDIIKDCRNMFFHTFDYRLVCDIIFTNSSNNEEVNFTITHKSMEFETDFYVLKKKRKQILLDETVVYLIK